MTRTVMACANSGWNLVNFRSALLAAVHERGWRVVAVAPPDPAADAALRALGCEVEPLALDSVGLSPVRDVDTLRELVRLMRRHRPSHYISWTPKPNVYGALAARMTGVRAMPNITGLGSIFIRDSAMTRLLLLIYRGAFARARTMFFQNATDRDLFFSRGLARPDQAVLLPGSGIDLDRFAPERPMQGGDGPLRFLLVARLLRDKGVEEFVAAARTLRAEGLPARFQLLGAVGAANPTAVTPDELAAWVEAGDVEYLGEADDVRPLVAAADCVVLPSYREGTARVLLEAGAMGKPAVATDVPGCRDPVVDGVTGLLCQVRSAASLAGAMRRMALMPASEREAMGGAARARMEAEYDQRIVIARYLAELDDPAPAASARAALRRTR